MSDTDESAVFLAICKKEFQPIVGDNDELPISHLGALKYGLRALGKEDAEDEARAEQLWAKAQRMLIEESEDDEGAGASGTAQFADVLDLRHVGGFCA